MKKLNLKLSISIKCAQRYHYGIGELLNLKIRFGYLRNGKFPAKDFILDEDFEDCHSIPFTDMYFSDRCYVAWVEDKDNAIIKLGNLSIPERLSHLPSLVIKRMLENQFMQGNGFDLSAFAENKNAAKLRGGFDFCYTEEDEDIWRAALEDNDFEPFFEFHKINIDQMENKVKFKRLEPGELVEITPESGVDMEVSNVPNFEPCIKKRVIGKVSSYGGNSHYLVVDAPYGDMYFNADVYSYSYGRPIDGKKQELQKRLESLKSEVKKLEEEINK